MSIESAESFLRKMKEDEDFWIRHNRAKTKEERELIIRNAGFNFSEEELKAAIDKLIEKMIANRYDSIWRVPKSGAKAGDDSQN